MKRRFDMYTLHQSPENHNRWLLVHSGSRILGARTAEYHEILALRETEAESPIKYLSGAFAGTRKPFYSRFSRESRRQASSTSGRWPKAEKRIKPSPAGPKPEPGVVTTRHVSRISAKTSQLSLPGKRAQM